MKKKVLLVGLILALVCGCTNIDTMSYDDIANTLHYRSKSPNVYKKGYQYFVPKGLAVKTGGTNYTILSSSDANYYLYVDFISYINNNVIEYEIDNEAIYSKKLNIDKKNGYIEIKLWENNQYLIEIMYNYAKIEVMVEEDLIKKALVNAISILDSMKYNDVVIERLLNDDELSYTEENFELFDKENNNSSDLEYGNNENIEEKEEIPDTDLIN